VNPLPSPTCSVCIANYNGASIIVDCVNSVLMQTGDLNIEIIIHDDASQDTSVEIIRQSFPANVYPQIQLIESHKNVGFCTSNNRMAAIAKGEYLLLLNNDAVLATDAVQTFVQTADTQSKKGILSLPQVDWASNELVDRGCMLDPFYNPVPNLDVKRSEVAMVIGACLWIPRHLWQTIGGFPEWFGSIAEDMLICTQARLMGYPVQVTDASHYRHKQGASFGGNKAHPEGLSTTYKRRRLSERNKTFVMILCTPGPLLIVQLLFHLFLLAIEGALLSIVKRDLRLWRQVYWNTFISLFKQARQLRHARSQVQSRRTVSAREFRKGFTKMPRKLVMLKRYGLPKVS